MRNIKSHKGGRTETIPPCRVTPDEKSLIDTAREDLSYSDFLVQSAQRKLKVRAKTPNKAIKPTANQ